MSESKNTKTLERYLVDTTIGNNTGRQQLVFNPSTGQLVVAQGESPDGLTVDSINREGFFTL